MPALEADSEHALNGVSGYCRGCVRARVAPGSINGPVPRLSVEVCLRCPTSFLTAGDSTYRRLFVPVLRVGFLLPACPQLSPHHILKV